MDFPLFHLDFMGNRMLVAVIAIIHVLINHAIAVGFVPIVTLLEYLGYKSGETEPEKGAYWDKFSYKLLFVAFVITTTVGALTGVGIWFAAALVNPASIASLIRVFYMAWFTEWLIFVTEVVLIMLYFLSWKRLSKTREGKRKHIIFGASLAIFSWLTMAIIVAILGFMMDPGNWLNDGDFWSGVLNPIYMPQLVFRTGVSMMMGGMFALFLSSFFLKKDNPVKVPATRTMTLYTLFWTPIAALGAFIYYIKIPDYMVGNLPVALGTQQFQEWYGSLIYVVAGAVAVAVLVCLGLLWKPRKFPKGWLWIPLILLFGFLGTFERLREFIRKPYVIADYMYANGLLKEDYALFKRDGVLPHSSYTNTSKVTERNRLEAGKNVFKIACTRCHTTGGINSIVTNFEKMYGAEKPFDATAMKAYISGMHNVKIFMPPFPGNEEELDALVLYIKSLQEHPETLEGVQINGTEVNLYKIKSDQ
ncbi:c-type cytochrome [Plebeiibacterium marinum]|uniref:Cytochrome c n=1 Tax=Plebeiibacterium marinum TaxID=2992111 RepID=A0AAE3MI06_9BACT|nr:c-type cytochrome [Plebeiobacterium marinum]MCW3807780.1 cytochrome c [Plebeiobacterium marinum]